MKVEKNTQKNIKTIKESELAKVFGGGDFGKLPPAAASNA